MGSSMADFHDSPGSQPDRVVLDGWKEIAFHFGVTVRTVQIWEAERALPVHRKPGPKGRVYAFADELQAWSFPQRFLDGETQPAFQGEPDREGLVPEEGGSSALTEEGDRDSVAGDDSLEASPELALQPLAPPRLTPGIWPLPARAWVVICLATLLLVIGGAWAARKQARRALVSVNATEWSLQGLDDNKRILWSYRWEHSYFHAFAAHIDPLTPLVDDVDGDGENEVYIWHQSLPSDNRPARNAVLYSFDAAGQLRWSFEPDTTLRTSYREFPAPYSGRAVRAVRYNGGRKRGILAVANHHMNYPARVMLFSSQGELLREYMHTGHLHLVRVEDFDQDGREEVYILGVANDYGAVDLTVLDPDTMQGASAEPRRQLLGTTDGPVVARGTELRRFILPRTHLGRTLDPYGTPADFKREGEFLVVSALEGWGKLSNPVCTYFQFDRQLRLVSSSVSENYLLSWELLHRQGILDRRFRPEDLAAISDVLDITGGRDLLSVVGSTPELQPSAD